MWFVWSKRTSLGIERNEAGVEAVGSFTGGRVGNIFLPLRLFSTRGAFRGEQRWTDRSFDCFVQ
ncbi:hypothetical protein N7504_004267 [Penicillium tannophilum]|nr:hypothetical protein N7504_004267 [Penicillium tannophilum]